MTSTDQPHLPDYKPAPIVRLALFAAVFAGAACAGQRAEMAKAHATGVVTAQASAPGVDTRDEAPVFVPLVQAAHTGDVEAARRQLDEGADVDAVTALGMTPLMWSFQPLIQLPWFRYVPPGLG